MTSQFVISSRCSCGIRLQLMCPVNRSQRATGSAPYIGRYHAFEVANCDLKPAAPGRWSHFATTREPLSPRPAFKITICDLRESATFSFDRVDRTIDERCEYWGGIFQKLMANCHRLRRKTPLILCRLVFFPPPTTATVAPIWYRDSGTVSGSRTRRGHSACGRRRLPETVAVERGSTFG